MIALILAVCGALASDPDVHATPEARAAEYQRLWEEMDRAARRTNWVAVERLYEKLDAMGQPHTQAVFLAAAQAARARGDITTAKARLQSANAIHPEKQVLDWLWQIQQEYGPVVLAADLPANYRLTPAAMPFNPEHRRVVEFAQGRVVEESFFDGLLPRGDYVFAPYERKADSLVFEFKVRENTQRYDLRTKDEPTRADRKKRARIDRRIARDEDVPEAT